MFHQMFRGLEDQSGQWQQSCLVRHKEATTTTTGSPATEAATSDPEAERQRLSAERLDLGGGGAWHG